MDVVGLTKSLQDILYNSMFNAQLSLIDEASVKIGEVSQPTKSTLQKTAADIATTFSTNAASAMANAIEKFVLSLKIEATPTKLTSPNGPVTGMITVNEFKLT